MCSLLVARKSLLIATTAEHYRLGEKGSLLNVYLFVGHGILYMRFCREFNTNNKIRQTADSKKMKMPYLAKKCNRKADNRISLVDSEDTNDNPLYRLTSKIVVGKRTCSRHAGSQF